MNDREEGRYLQMLTPQSCQALRHLAQLADRGLPLRPAGPDTDAHLIPAFATHRTRSLRPVKSGGAEDMIAAIDKVVEKWKTAVLQYDAELQAYQHNYMWGVSGDVPVKPDRDVYVRQLVHEGVPRDSAERYLDNALKGKRK